MADMHLEQQRFVLWDETTCFERLIRRVIQLPWWLNIGLAVGLLGMPFALAYAEGQEAWAMVQISWRFLVLPGALLIYTFAAIPWIWQIEHQTVEALRPLVHLNAESFDHLVRHAGCRTALGAWGGCALLITQPTMAAGLTNASPQYLFLWLAYLVMFGLTGWSTYNSLTSARLTAALQRHINDVDLFNLQPFEAVGRQGLALSLLLIGGITLSLVFVYRHHDFLYWQNLVLYLVLSTASVLVCFLVMWPTHHTLEQFKTQKLLLVQHSVGQRFHLLEELTSSGGDTQPVSYEIQALLALEQRLKLVPTWPYTVDMLRTLLLSSLTPAIVAGTRLIGTLIAEGYL